MPITKVRTPSGEIVQVSHPEGATDDEIIAYAKANAQPQPKEQAAPKGRADARDAARYEQPGGRAASVAQARLARRCWRRRPSFGSRSSAKAARTQSGASQWTMRFSRSALIRRPGGSRAANSTGEVAGTAGVGPAASILARSLGAGPAVVQALSTAGMTTGRAPATVAGKAADMALRSAAGGAVGARLCWASSTQKRPALVGW